MLLEVLGDLLAEHGSLCVGGAEVDAGPHSGVDEFLERIREPIETPSCARLIAECAEGDLVGLKEVLEGVNDCTSSAGVSRGVVGEGRSDERWEWHRRGRVEQRQPRRVGLGSRVAVGVGLADRRDRTPELPVVLVVPATDRGVSRSQVGHGEQAGVLDDVQSLAGGQRPKDPVPEEIAIVCPEDRSIGFVRRSGRARE